MAYVSPIRSARPPALQKAIDTAQRDADREHRTMLVLNLNQYSPMYVVREWSQKARNSHEFVIEIEPSMYV